MNALELADALENEHDPWPSLLAAAELRRLHAQRDALLEALRETLRLARQSVDEEEWNAEIFGRARAAIAKAEEQT